MNGEACSKSPGRSIIASLTTFMITPLIWVVEHTSNSYRILTRREGKKKKKKKKIGFRDHRSRKRRISDTENFTQRYQGAAIA